VSAYWEELKRFHVGVVVAAAAELKHRLARFPTIADWSKACRGESVRRAENRRAQQPRPAEASATSRWAVVANRVLLQLAYFDRRRGFTPLDDALLARVLEVKAKIVGDAEEFEAAGDAWTVKELVDVLQTAFEKLLLPERAA